MDKFEQCFFDLLKEELNKQMLNFIVKNDNYVITSNDEICYINNFGAYYDFIHLKQQKAKAVLIKRDCVFIADNKNLDNTVPAAGNGKDYSYHDAVKQIIDFLLKK